MSDVQNSLRALAQDPAGLTNPFDIIYRIVFQLTIRIVGCNDIAEDPELLGKTLKLYEYINSSATATAVMFPWFPSPAVVKGTIAGGRLYMIIRKIVNERKVTGKRGNDPLQFLIDQGNSMAQIIEVRHLPLSPALCVPSS